MDKFKKESERFTIEENREYYVRTTAKIKEIEDAIQNLETTAINMTDDDKHKALNNVVDKIKSERNDFYNLIDFLANYDKTLYAKMYEDLLDKVAKVKLSLFPKKKFAFSSKVARKPNTSNSNSNVSTNTTAQTNQSSSSELTQQNDVHDLIIKDINGTQVKYMYGDPKLANKNNLMLENISNAEIYVLSNVKCCFAKNITNTKLVIGSVSGGAHFTSCNNCDIHIATHQLRIHNTTSTNFYVMINSKPIIEHSTNNTFFPLKIQYNGYDDNISKANIDTNDNKYSQVQDFQWLKQERSPNFAVLDNNDLFTIA